MFLYPSRGDTLKGMKASFLILLAAMTAVSGCAGYDSSTDYSSNSSSVGSTPDSQAISDHGRYEPAGYSNIGYGIAYKWLPARDCTNAQFMICWQLELATAEPCATAVARFTVSDEQGQRLGRFWSAAPLYSAGGQAWAVEFGSVTPVVAEVFGEVISVSCLEMSDAYGYNAAYSMIDLPGSYCGGSCTVAVVPVAPTLPEYSEYYDYSEYYGYWKDSYLPEYTIPERSGTGYMVFCNDGTVSYSGGKQGACSWHGGVR